MSSDHTPDLPSSLQPDDERFADSVRRLIRMQRSSTVEADEVARAHALVREAADILGASQRGGPYWQAGVSTFDEFEVAERFQDIFPWSPAFGVDNPVAPKVEFEFDDDARLRGTAWFDSCYCGPPWDVTHGGIVALVYDDILGATAAVAAGGGMTGRLSISYRSTTPLFEPISMTAHLLDVDGRKFRVAGAMHHGETLLSEAEGLFIRPATEPTGVLVDEMDFGTAR